MKKIKFILYDRSLNNPRVSEHEDHGVAMVAYREYIRRLNDIRDLMYIDVRCEIYEEKD